MKDRIEAAFAPLHTTLARLNLLAYLTDDNVRLRIAEQQELSDWLRELSEAAVDEAIAAEISASKLETEAQE